MTGIRFTEYKPQNNISNKFEQLLNIFLQLLIITSGNVEQALDLLNQIDQKYGLTGNDYGMGDFIEELKDKNYIRQSENNSLFIMTTKSERTIRRKSLEEIFVKLEKSICGNHPT
ncbi:MAG TPA: hypothetical protein ENI76_05510, partial [Ignavibacteria bacterium]|nr:hypothetical protein [Ignavibacteria bacterium]